MDGHKMSDEIKKVHQAKEGLNAGEGHKGRSHRQKICAGVFGFLLAVCVLLSVCEGFGADRDMGSGITVSHESGFYSEAFDLKLYGENVKEIYYTLDGSLPEAGGEKTLKYVGGGYRNCL